MMHAVYYGTLLLAIFEQEDAAISLVEYAMSMGLITVCRPTEYAIAAIKGGPLSILESHAVLRFKGLI